jgi:hypothetical protein
MAETNRFQAAAAEVVAAALQEGFSDHNAALLLLFAYRTLRYRLHRDETPENLQLYQETEAAMLETCDRNDMLGASPVAVNTAPGGTS